MTLTALLGAIRDKNITEAHATFTAIMQGKVNARLKVECRSLLEGTPPEHVVALTPARLMTLLRDASTAHHAYEQQLGKPDPDWQGWYAAHMVDTMTDEDINMNAKKVKAMLVAAEKAHGEAGKPGDWIAWYANHMAKGLHEAFKADDLLKTGFKPDPKDIAARDAANADTRTPAEKKKAYDDDTKRRLKENAKGVTYHMCDECERSFSSTQLVDGKFPQHTFLGKPCPGSGTSAAGK
jgi:hypothetical protein